MGGVIVLEGWWDKEGLVMLIHY